MFFYNESFLSPIGHIEVTASQQGLRSVKLVVNVQPPNPSVLTTETIHQLQGYFDKKLTKFDLDFDWMGATDFYQQVWGELIKIPYGGTQSYQNIANAIQNPKAVRAVGMANAKNPIAIIVPCHRVIGSNGSLTGYAYGIDIKKQLLALELPKIYGKQQELF